MVFEGTMHWHTYKSQGITCVMLKDKKHVLLISTHVHPTKLPTIHNPLAVPRRNGDTCNYIILSPVYYEYTIHICGVDVVN